MNVALYVRCSTKGQAEDDRLGLPTQIAALEAFCEANGHRIVERFVDAGYSGATVERPELGLLLEAPKGAFDAVVVYKWDRLARDAMLDGFIRYSLKRKGVRCISATETNGVDEISTLTQSILAAVAQYERHLIAQRLAGARRVKAARGGFAHGQVPFGYRTVNATLVEEPTEQGIISTIVELNNGGRSVREIAAFLNVKGLKPRRADKWGPSSIVSVLQAARDREIGQAMVERDVLDRVAAGQVL
jgi:DNA invertase Pin-like site-specific DNA recombinase